jgi:5-methylcytosine-specific restriction endonuclease McrA
MSITIREKRKNISGALKRDVWLKYIGNKARSKCFCCMKNTIFLCSGLHNTWQAGHIISHNNGGLAEINNLHPICKQCNNAMNDENWDDYVNRHKNLYHSWDWNIENYYKKYEKGIIWWQSLYRMHLSRIKSI